MDRAQALQQQIEYYQQHQQQLLGDIQRGLYDASSVSTQLTAPNLRTRQFRLDGQMEGKCCCCCVAGPGQRLSLRHLGGRHSGTDSDAGLALAHTQLR